MGMFTLTSSKLYLDQFDISGDMNSIALDYSADAVDSTTFGQTTKIRAGGFKGVALACQGYWQGGATAIDGVLWNRIAVADSVTTVCGQTGAIGETAYFFKSMAAKYAVGGQVGAMFPFSASAEASTGRLVRGKVMAAAGNKTSTANGTAYQVGAASATQYLYAALHVLSVSGTSPTLDVVIASDNAENFASGQTRMTFAQKTAVGAQYLTPVAGPQTDDWWRAQWTIGGSDTPTFSFVVVFGIL